MGAGNSAQARATLSNTVNAYVSAVQNSTNSAVARSTNNVNFSCKNTKDCVFNNINIVQTAESYASAQFSNTNDATILQKVSASLDNSAQSLVSGLGLGNSTASESNISNYVNTSMDLAQNITNNCASIAENNVNVVVENADIGGASNFNVSQNSKAVLDCIGKNANSLLASQTTDVVAKNSASAVTKGIEIPNFLAGLLGMMAIMAALFLVPAFLFQNTFKTLFPKIAMVALMIAGVYLLVLGGTSKIEELESICDETFTAVDSQKNKKKVFIKPFFFTCGIYGKGLSNGTCTNLFTPPSNVVVGSFTSITQNTTTLSPSIQTGRNGCSFEIVSNSVTFDSISDAYNYFVNSNDFVALDALYSLDGKVRYIFYKTVNPTCLIQLQSDFQDPNLTQWTGVGKTIQTNPWYPPMVCVVLPCVEGIPSSTDSDVKPYYIRISKNGNIYYYKNGAWVTANSASWIPDSDVNMSDIPLDNILVYKGTLSQTPNILSTDKNPKLKLDKKVLYINVDNESQFDIWLWTPGTTVTDNQGFVFKKAVSVATMKNDGVVAFGANPLLKFMNRTWVKLTTDFDEETVLKKLLTDNELDALKSGYVTELQKSNYLTCKKNQKLIKEAQNKRTAFYAGGSIALIMGFIGLTSSIIFEKAGPNMSGGAVNLTSIVPNKP